MNHLRILQMEKRYNQTKKIEKDSFRLHPISLEIRPGEFFSLLGPSGCGKTTLLKLVAGLLEADSGELWFGESNLTKVPPEERKFAMVFQQSLLFPHMTIGDNVAFGLKMQKVAKTERLLKAKEMLTRVGLAGFDHRFPDELSGGQQQRVALARALVASPRLLLMDEPFSALDPSLREEMRELLSSIQKQFGVTVLFVTHDRQEAFDLSDRVGIMNDGRLLQVGTAKELYQQPGTTQIASFLGIKNIIRGIVSGDRFTSADDAFEFKVSETVKPGDSFVIIRSEALQLRQDNVSLPDGSMCIKGEINQLKFNQGFYQSKLMVGNTQLDCFFSPQQANLIEIGQTVDFFVLPNDLQLVEK